MIRKLPLFALLTCILVAPFHLMGRDEMFVRQYTVQNGLPHNTTYTILKDQDGFMWFGTWYGLCRFDGQRFNPYITSSQISPRKIEDIIEDRNGYIWIKTIDQKLFVFSRRKEQFTPLNSKVEALAENAQVIKIQRSQDGKILLLTKSKDLLIGETDNDKIVLHHLVSTKNVLNPIDYVLRRNVVGETQSYFSYVGTDYSIFASPKGTSLTRKNSDFLLQKIGGSIPGNILCAASLPPYVWLADKSNQLLRLNTENGDIDRIRLHTLPENVKSIIPIDVNNLYLIIGDNNHLYHYHWQQSDGHLLSSAIPPGVVNDTRLDARKGLWIFTAGKHVSLYTPDKQLLTYNFAKPKTIRPFHFIDMSKNMQSVGITSTAGEALFFDYIDKQFHPAEKLLPKLPNGDSYDVAEQWCDESGILWYATLANGIFRINSQVHKYKIKPIESYASTHSPTADEAASIRALTTTRNGDIWVGTRTKAVYRLNKKKELLQRFDASTFPIGNVYHILEDPTGTLWFSTKGSGLVKATPNPTAPYGYDFSRFLHDEMINHSISSNNVYYTQIGKQGRLWIATMGGGINMLNPSDPEPRFYHKNNGFIGYPRHGFYMDVRNMQEDTNGRVWFGCTDGLLSVDTQFDKPEKALFETYRREQDNINVGLNDIYVMYKDSNQKIWIGVFGGGLYRIDAYNIQNKKPDFTTFGSKEGLNNNVIISITEDPQKNLWIVTENGLSRFNPKSGRFQNFDHSDGFPLSKIEDNTVISLGNNELWFGTQNGILQLDLNNPKEPITPYKLFIVGIQASKEKLTASDPQIDNAAPFARQLRLDYDESMFSIEFAAVNHPNLSRVSYRYKLEGYDPEWNYSGKSRIAHYSNVPPGRYKFCVEAIDNNTSLQSPTSSIEVIIRPPWWRTGIAYLLYAILIAILLYFTIRFILLMIRMKNDVYIEQKLSDLKLRFFTNITHELRTPLTLIKAPIQELKEGETLTEKGREYILLMEKNTELMLNLVNQILDFRKIQNGKMRLNVSKINLNQITKDLYNEFRMLGLENRINYILDQPEETICLYVDKERLQIVLRNLLSNAFKFTKAEGKIILKISQSDETGKCMITVIDTGIGIAHNKLSVIFERFSQADNLNEATSRGTGIGLALSKDIIEFHHGTIEVESTERKGSAFTVILPLGKEHFSDSEATFYLDDSVEPNEITYPEETEKESTALTVDRHPELPLLLLVEDNRDLSKLIRLQLEEKYRIVVASNGVEALQIIEQYMPDIVVTDLMMPEMDGLELLRRIRSNFQISHIPVIILSAKNNEESKTEATNTGANAYITKPFSKDYLIARIDQLLADVRVFKERMYNTPSEEEYPSEFHNHLAQKDIDLLNNINRIIREKIDDPELSIDSMASTLGLSRSSFFKKLKSLSGLAPVDFIKEVRLSTALQLLQVTGKSISEIAYAVGFSDSGYFIKCFRKKYNKTPKEMANEIRARADESPKEH